MLYKPGYHNLRVSLLVRIRLGSWNKRAPIFEGEFVCLTWIAKQDREIGVATVVVDLDTIKLRKPFEALLILNVEKYH